jgi:hypothetical protein
LHRSFAAAIRPALAPLGFEVIEPGQGGVGILGAIDRLDRGQDCLAILSRHDRLLPIKCTMQV